MRLKGVVLVTGGAGFIGSALVRELLKENADVVVYDNLYSGDVANLKEIKDEIRVMKGDVRSSGFKDVLIKNEVDYVFNLAAEPYIPYCYERPREFFDVNAGGTLNVLLACKEAAVKRILHYSSSEVYGTAKYVPMDENHPTLPCSTYSVSKLAADRLCFTLYHEQNIPVIILRQFNVYGPRETQPYIIPELISQLTRTNKLRLGNIEARRDLTYVEDAAEGAVALMKCEKAVGETINLGYGKDWSVGELAHIIAELLGWNSVKISIEKQRLRPLDVERLYCDYRKAKKFIDWDPKTRLEDGLKGTIEWYKKNGEKWIWETKIAPEEKIWKKRSN